jgi:hypothetical protein
LACAPPVIVAPFGETDIERSRKAETRLLAAREIRPGAGLLPNKIAHRFAARWSSGRWLSSPSPTTCKAGVIASLRHGRLALARALHLTAAETGIFFVVCRGGLRRLRRYFRDGRPALCSGVACMADLKVRSALSISTSGMLAQSGAKWGQRRSGPAKRWASGARWAMGDGRTAIASTGDTDTPPKRFAMMSSHTTTGA